MKPKPTWNYAGELRTWPAGSWNNIPMQNNPSNNQKPPAPKKRIKSQHICGRCGTEFFSKAKCWYHMDFECPKRIQSK